MDDSNTSQDIPKGSKGVDLERRDISVLSLLVCSGALNRKRAADTGGGMATVAGFQ
jgi:hypothetical protein